MNQNILRSDDTIAAISTGNLHAGIGIIRISGDAALQVMKKIFKEAPPVVKERYAYYGHVIDKTNQVLDEAIFIYMKGPKSYTGEDTLEIQAHGSPQGLRQILRASLETSPDVREAHAGEFTRRAFLNGKLDLLQAESIIDYINASSQLALDMAIRQKEGRLSRQIKMLREELKTVLAEMLVELDYPEETLDIKHASPFAERIRCVLEELRLLYDTRSIGKIAKEGLRVLIIGKPNVGKSTLFNALLGENRAIVSNLPGTTRDIISENLSVNGAKLAILDSAGIRQSEDQIENEGISRTFNHIKEADIILAVMDASQGISSDDLRILDELKAYKKQDYSNKVIFILNKTDHGKNFNTSILDQEFPEARILEISLKDEFINASIAAISEALSAIQQNYLSSQENTEILSNERQARIIEDALTKTEIIYENILEGQELDFVELDLREIYDELGEIIGESAGEEILEEVFNKFCLGK